MASFSADYYLFALCMQNIQIVQEKFDYSIKQFDPSSNIFFFTLFKMHWENWVPSSIFINNECIMTSKIEAS